MDRRRKTKLVPILLLLALSTLASTQIRAQQPVYDPGTRWTWDDFDIDPVSEQIDLGSEFTVVMTVDPDRLGEGGFTVLRNESDSGLVYRVGYLKSGSETALDFQAPGWCGGDEGDGTDFLAEAHSLALSVSRSQGRAMVVYDGNPVLFCEYEGPPWPGEYWSIGGPEFRGSISDVMMWREAKDASFLERFSVQTSSDQFRESSPDTLPSCTEGPSYIKTPFADCKPNYRSVDGGFKCVCG